MCRTTKASAIPVVPDSEGYFTSVDVYHLFRNFTNHPNVLTLILPRYEKFPEAIKGMLSVLSFPNNYSY